MTTRTKDEEKFREYWSHFKAKEGSWNIDRQSRREFWKQSWDKFKFQKDF
jgi:hypothetical protein